MSNTNQDEIVASVAKHHAEMKTKHQETCPCKDCKVATARNIQPCKTCGGSGYDKNGLWCDACGNTGQRKPTNPDTNVGIKLTEQTDELEEQILNDLSHTLKLMPKNNRLAFGLEVARYVLARERRLVAEARLEQLNADADHWFNCDGTDCEYDKSGIGMCDYFDSRLIEEKQK